MTIDAVVWRNIAQNIGNRLDTPLTTHLLLSIDGNPRVQVARADTSIVCRSLDPQIIAWRIYEWSNQRHRQEKKLNICNHGKNYDFLLLYTHKKKV